MQTQYEKLELIRDAELLALAERIRAELVARAERHIRESAGELRSAAVAGGAP